MQRRKQLSFHILKNPFFYTCKIVVVTKNMVLYECLTIFETAFFRYLPTTGFRMKEAISHANAHSWRLYLQLGMLTCQSLACQVSGANPRRARCTSLLSSRSIDLKKKVCPSFGQSLVKCATVTIRHTQFGRFRKIACVVNADSHCHTMIQIILGFALLVWLRLILIATRRFR